MPVIQNRVLCQDVRNAPSCHRPHEGGHCSVSKRVIKCYHSARTCLSHAIVIRSFGLAYRTHLIRRFWTCLSHAPDSVGLSFSATPRLPVLINNCSVQRFPCSPRPILQSALIYSIACSPCVQAIDQPFCPRRWKELVHGESRLTEGSNQVSSRSTTE